MKRIAKANVKMCICCKLCSPIEAPCPTGSITYDEIGKVVINESTCTGCGLCQKRCPKGIISIKTIHTHE